jgi:hypothetical protein
MSMAAPCCFNLENAAGSDLHPAVDAHLKPSELFWPQQSVGEINKQSGGHETSEGEVVDHLNNLIAGS